MRKSARQMARSTNGPIRGLTQGSTKLRRMSAASSASEIWMRMRTSSLAMRAAQLVQMRRSGSG